MHISKYAPDRVILVHDSTRVFQTSPDDVYYWYESGIVVILN